MLCPLGAVLLFVLHESELLGGPAFVDGESALAALWHLFYVAAAPC